MNTRYKKSHLSLIIATYIFLYLPILVLIIFSFNNQKFPSHWSGFTWNWYIELFQESALWNACFTSFFVATVSTIITLFMALSLIFFHFSGGKIQKTLPLFYTNLIIPEIMLSISLLTFFVFFKVSLGITTLIIAHTVLGLGFAVPMIYSRYSQLDPSIFQAAKTLGASSYQTFTTIVLPLLKPALISSSVLIFILSFDDFIFSCFCAGTSVETVSLYLLSMLRLGISPIINALSTLLFLISAVAALIFLKSKSKGDNLI
ncbi:spermidine/putrescine ABC transporter permease [Candidatus Aerophobetes bacterium]|uniref:Spermidine/putrescine ABC transporter permease n=1 Tax=Aerophobetes bacterium TaxID=2030807 RepID=A0A2A4X7W7_UNCAE|nr:MAG: spermidine/putrescine ABC transporter permease [Candidatus Aerophobetes bacterium]